MNRQLSAHPSSVVMGSPANLQRAMDDDHVAEQSAIPRICTLKEAAEILRVQPEWLRERLAARKFAALKQGNRWAMTESQILGAIESMSTKVVIPDHLDPARNPMGLTRTSYRRRIRRQS